MVEDNNLPNANQGGNRVMRKLGKVAAALAVGAALAAPTAATAAAAPPEFGHCVEVAPKTGEYGDGACLKPAPGKGKFDFQAGPGAKKKFTGTGGQIAFETADKVKILCTGGSKFSGEYTGAKTETVSINLTGCVNERTTQTCQTVPVKSGEIEGPALEGEIGFIVGGATPTVGLDLKHSPDLFSFECGSLKGTFSLVTVEGSVIAVIRPLEHATETFKLLYKATAGKQKPEQFEGGPKDTLTANFTTGMEKVSQPAVLIAKEAVLIKNEEPLEIKAK